jgi:hypothetical protein
MTMSEISTIREMRPAPPPAELEAMRMAARERFVAGAGSRRVRHQWRLPLASGLTAAAAATAAAALVLTSGPGAEPGQRGTAGDTRVVITAAWTVREDADGTVTIYLRQYANPAALQQTLQADGINAIVRPIPTASRLFGRSTITYPTCNYAPTDVAPGAVQRASVTFAGEDFPVRFIIHPDAMPRGSALFLAFSGGLQRSPKNGNTGVIAPPPVVLNNDTVPACVPRTKPLPFSVLPAPASSPKVK